MVAGLAVGSLVGGIFQLVQGLAELRFLGRMEASLEAAVWDRLLNLPAVFFRRFSSGDLANRAETIYQIQQIISGAVMTSLLSGIFCAFNIALLFYYGPMLGILALAILFVAVITMLGLFSMQLRYLRPQLDLGGKISDFNVQILNSIAKLRANAAEMRAFHRWSQIYSQYKTLNVKYRKLSVLISIFRATLPLVATLAIFAALAYTWKPDDPAIETGQFLAFTAAMTAVISAVMAAVSDFTAVFSVVPMYERMKPIISQEPETQTGQRDPGKLTGSVEMAHVNFRYKSDGPLILKDVSLQADPGEFIALVGPSGSGKSTILRLLIQFETPESGSIFYDGQRLAELDIQAVRRQLGVVLQGGRLLSGNIYESITGGLQLTTEEAWEAARMASLDKDIEAMPMGMYTIIGEGGSVLSGGQRQRLLIAKAIVRKPRIVFFDEATSALDNISQAQVSKSLEDLKATRIVIAHRLSTIRNADRIYVLVRGQVVESGSYDELMANRGVFSELAKRQIA
jgi:ATP-binding cassette subfamily C protein